MCVCVACARTRPSTQLTTRASTGSPWPGGLIQRLGGERRRCGRANVSLVHECVFFVVIFFLSLLCVHCARCALARLSSSLRDELCCVGGCGEGKKTHTHHHQYVGGFFSLAAVVFAFFTSVTPDPPPFPFPSPSHQPRMD